MVDTLSMALRLYLRTRYQARQQRLTSPGILTMYDAVTAANLPAGGQAYVFYLDGNWPTVAAIPDYPGVYHLILTTGLGPAEGIDVEPGNESWNDDCAAVPGWVRGRLDAGVSRPVVYISSSYGQFIIDKLAAAGIARDQFRLFTAHWTVKHICNPQVCGNATADATQWDGNVNNAYDVSAVHADFFTAAVVPPAPPVVKPVVQEDFMKVVMGTGVPSKTDGSPVFVLWAGAKRWLANETLVGEWLALTGQGAIVKCPWAVLETLPDAPGSTPVPL